jgi:hypothetical protein
MNPECPISLELFQLLPSHVDPYLQNVLFPLGITRHATCTTHLTILDLMTPEDSDKSSINSASKYIFTPLAKIVNSNV